MNVKVLLAVLLVISAFCILEPRIKILWSIYEEINRLGWRYLEDEAKETFYQLVKETVGFIVLFGFLGTVAYYYPTEEREKFAKNKIILPRKPAGKKVSKDIFEESKILKYFPTIGFLLTFWYLILTNLGKEPITLVLNASIVSILVTVALLVVQAILKRILER